MNGWQEKEVYNISDTVISEVQSARCPHCKKILTTPYLYYFDEFPFCPSCGKRVSGKKTALEAAAEIIVKKKCPKDYGIEVGCIDNCTICWGREVGEN